MKTKIEYFQTAKIKLKQENLLWTLTELDCIKNKKEKGNES